MSIQALLQAMDFSQSFASFRQAPEPCDGAFDDPSAGKEFEALGGVGALDYFERPLADLVQGATQFRSGVSAVGKRVAQPGACMAYRSQHRRSAIAVLYIGCMHDQPEEHPSGIDDGVALAAFDLLTSVIGANPPWSSRSGCG